MNLMVLEEERVQCQPQGDSHRDSEGMKWREDVSRRQHMGQVRWMWKKRERFQCIAEEARSTIHAERLIRHEMDIVEMQAGQP